MLSLAVALLVLGLIGAPILRRHLREAKLLRLREISHKERIMAMERNLPAPESDAIRIDSLLNEGNAAGTGGNRMSSVSVHWLRLAALCLGLTCLFGGLGIVAGLYLLADPEVRSTWPTGLIAVFIGVGLLIFVRLSRGFADRMNSG